MELRGLGKLLLAMGVLALAAPGAAAADSVLVMHANGSVSTAQNPFITAADSQPLGAGLSAAATTVPAVRRPAARSRATPKLTTATTYTGTTPTATPTPTTPTATTATTTTTTTTAAPTDPTGPKAAVTVTGTLLKLEHAGQISLHNYHVYVNAWNAALNEEKQISRYSSTQLSDVTELLHTLAVDGRMTASRLPVLFLILDRNAQWWRSGPALGYGERVQFAGSNIEWEFYPGQGIQLQVLGTFGEANGYYEAGPADYAKLRSLLAEMIPLAVSRGGGIAWEYYFDFDGGVPPWVSGMAQATGIEALTNAYKATHDPNYLTVAHDALGILHTAPPTGVAVHGPLGLRFTQYDFAPKDEILNADLQTLIGLDDYYEASNDPLAGHLFREGNLQAAADVPAFNLGGWSLYQPGETDDLSYHQLVTGFLQTLCTLTTGQALPSAQVYCATGKAFQADLTTPPALTILTTAATANTGFHLTFTLNKPAHIGVVVSDASGKDWLYTSADCGPGTDYFLGPQLPAGTYTVKLSGTDLAGNYSATSGTLTVS